MPLDGQGTPWSAVSPDRDMSAASFRDLRRRKLIYVDMPVHAAADGVSVRWVAPAHLPRKVLEEAVDFVDAKEQLAKTPVAIPAIYVLAGAGDGCVIEAPSMIMPSVRSMPDGMPRRTMPKRECVPRGIAGARGPLPRDHKWLGLLPVSTIDGQFNWFISPIANAHSRLVTMACGATGTPNVFGAYCEKRVTEAFRRAA